MRGFNRAWGNGPPFVSLPTLTFTSSAKKTASFRSVLLMGPIASSLMLDYILSFLFLFLYANLSFTSAHLPGIIYTCH